MKGGKKLSDWQQEEANKLPPINCHICKKGIPGGYGWTDIGGYKASCSARCESVMATLRENRYAALPHQPSEATEHL